VRQDHELEINGCPSVAAVNSKYEMAASDLREMIDNAVAEDIAGILSRYPPRILWARRTYSRQTVKYDTDIMTDLKQRLQLLRLTTVLTAYLSDRLL